MAEAWGAMESLGRGGALVDCTVFVGAHGHVGAKGLQGVGDSCGSSTSKAASQQVLRRAQLAHLRGGHPRPLRLGQAVKLQ